MGYREDRVEPDRQTMADLSALADGTLDLARAGGVRHRIGRSPELRRRYERERQVVEVLRTTRTDRAPHHLRMSIDNRRRLPVRRPRTRLVPVGVLATAVSAAVAALVLLLPGGTPGATSVSQAAALALRGPAMAAPPSQGRKLNQDVQDVYFPDWSPLGWHAVGQRIDRLDNRLVVTVYYERAGRQVAYTILGMPALARPGAPAVSLRGVEYQAFQSRGRVAVTWRRNGHTCILSSATVPVAGLAKLAAREA